MSDDDDMSTTIKAKSDQLNADDLIAGPLTGRITRVEKKDNEQQPTWVYLDSWPQPYKPCKTMRRILVDLWGAKGSAWVGHSLRLYRDPTVKYGSDAIGGIKIGAMTGISRTHETFVTLTRGKKQKHTVDVITDVISEWASKFSNASTSEELTQLGTQLREAKLSKDESDELRAIYQRRSVALKAATDKQGGDK